MKTPRITLVAIALAGCAFLVSAGVARADGSDLTGSVGIDYLYPNTSTVFASGSIAVGSSLTCPGSSAICNAYLSSPSGPPIGSQTFSVGLNSISYLASGYPGTYAAATFNGLSFTGLTFSGGGSLSGYSIVTNTIGLTSSDITFGSNYIDIDLAGLPVDGSFTLDLMSSGGTVTPEPSSIVLLGTGLLAFFGYRKRSATA
jgi:hypothetical protein